MEYIKKEELIEGEIYKVQEGDFSMIGLITLIDNGKNDLYSKRGNATFITTKNELRKDSSWCYMGTNRNITNTTPEEKHWLNTSIEQDKFITFEEAMKTFVPEYVECINPDGWKETIKNNNGNLIFDTKIESVNILGNDWKKIIKDTTMSFKPSTKEAYDAQFVVKEPEFIEYPINTKVLNTQTNAIYFKQKDGWYMVNNKTAYTDEMISKSNYINVIKDIKELNPLPQFKVIESIETITKVENNEGNQFFIGDTVNTPANNIFTIKGFKYNIDNTNILAILNNNSIIGIDKIEHCIEPKVEVEETLLDKAKRLYPIGTKFKSATTNKLFTVKDHNNLPNNSTRNLCFNTIEPNENDNYYACIHSTQGIWAEIVK